MVMAYACVRSERPAAAAKKTAALYRENIRATCERRRTVLCNAWLYASHPYVWCTLYDAVHRGAKSRPSSHRRFQFVCVRRQHRIARAHRLTTPSSNSNRRRCTHTHDRRSCARSCRSCAVTHHPPCRVRGVYVGCINAFDYYALVHIFIKVCVCV